MSVVLLSVPLLVEILVACFNEPSCIDRGIAGAVPGAGQDVNRVFFKAERIWPRICPSSQGNQHQAGKQAFSDSLPETIERTPDNSQNNQP